MRKYQSIWLQLKSSPKKTQVVLHPAHLHARLIKAVLKERTMDTGFRYELAEADSHAKVLTSSEGNLITFRLRTYLLPEDV
jgi:hypothetical protein